MALWSRTKEPAPAVISAEELLARFQLVEVNENAILVQEAKKLADPSQVSFAEMGSTSPGLFVSPNRTEYNSKLRGARGLAEFDKMRRSDGQVRATLRLAKTPVLAARWYLEPASNSRQDQKIAEFVTCCFMQYTTSSWHQTLSEILLSLDFGHYMLEKVFTFRDNKIIWKKLAPRHPMDILEWHFDAHGGPKSCEFYTTDPSSPIDIPIKKLLVFSHDMEAGNIEGISILRSAYKHWYYKDNFYKIDAIQKERHGVGVPIIKLPPNFSEPDKNIAEEMGRNLRTNEKAHVVLPPMWDLLMLKMEGQPVDSLPSINHHDMMIARNILGQFLNVADGGNKDDQDMFLKATRHIADQVRDIFNKHAIPELVDYNWKNVDEYPELRVRRIGETTDWRTISFAIRNFVGAQVLVPDERLETWIRDEMDLPKSEPATKREPPTPQAPGGGGKPPAPPKVGPPRQSQASNTVGTAGSTKVGRDTSGGRK